jgi:probable F420-dependent oxidoreductase
MRPFRFGVSVRSAGSRAEWEDKARKFEALGYSTLTVPDHLAEMIAPIPALVSAAAVTKTLRIGTVVLNNDFRHPVLLAREAATVDLLTDGRLELGLGAGHMRAEYDQAGLGFDAGGARVERLAEAVAIIKGLLRGELAYPSPVQRPHPPIFIGGNVPRLLTLAAKEADIVGLTGITFRSGGADRDISGFRASDVDTRVALVREAAGDRYDKLELNTLVQRVVVTGDRRQAAEELARRWTQLHPDDILRSPYALVGSVDQLVEPDRDAFAPVVARLAGS